MQIQEYSLQYRRPESRQKERQSQRVWPAPELKQCNNESNRQKGHKENGEFKYLQCGNQQMMPCRHHKWRIVSTSAYLRCIPGMRQEKVQWIAHDHPVQKDPYNNRRNLQEKKCNENCDCAFSIPPCSPDGYSNADGKETANRNGLVAYHESSRNPNCSSDNATEPIILEVFDNAVQTGNKCGARHRVGHAVAAIKHNQRSKVIEQAPQNSCNSPEPKAP